MCLRGDIFPQVRSEGTIIAASTIAAAAPREALTKGQVAGFWASWWGWTLDGMDSVIYALVLTPALRELLPRSGILVTPGSLGFIGSILFAVFLAGWGCAFIWGPIADRYGRTKTLAATIVVFSIFTGAAALSTNVWELGVFRFLAGIGIGGEWALAGTYVSEAWPESRRKQGAGYLQTGYYSGFFIAALLNFTIGASYGWRAMFACGIIPVVVSIFALIRVHEPQKWERAADHAKRTNPLAGVFSGVYLRRTVVNILLVTVAIVGLWGGSVYVPTAVTHLADVAGITGKPVVYLASLATAVLSIGTIIGCLALPSLAERYGRRTTMAGYFLLMGISLIAAFGWAFYLPSGLTPFIVLTFFLGLGGASFAMFSLWLPEQYPTRMRATAFAASTSLARFIGAAINFGIGGLIVANHGSLGLPVALTAVAFGIGILILPFAFETRGQALPD